MRIRLHETIKAAKYRVFYYVLLQKTFFPHKNIYVPIFCNLSRFLMQRKF